MMSIHDRFRRGEIDSVLRNNAREAGCLVSHVKSVKESAIKN